jgi:hypothetical protein
MFLDILEGISIDQYPKKNNPDEVSLLLPVNHLPPYQCWD